MLDGASLVQGSVIYSGVLVLKWHRERGGEKS